MSNWNKNIILSWNKSIENYYNLTQTALCQAKSINCTLIMDYIRGFFCVESFEMFDEYWRSKGWLWRENLYQYLEGEGGGHLLWSLYGFECSAASQYVYAAFLQCLIQSRVQGNFHSSQTRRATRGDQDPTGTWPASGHLPSVTQSYKPTPCCHKCECQQADVKLQTSSTK